MTVSYWRIHQGTGFLGGVCLTQVFFTDNAIGRALLLIVGSFSTYISGTTQVMSKDDPC